MSSDGSNPELDSRQNELKVLQRQLNEVTTRIEGASSRTQMSAFFLQQRPNMLSLSLIVEIDGQCDEMNTNIREKTQACDKAKVLRGLVVFASI